MGKYSNSRILLWNPDEGCDCTERRGYIGDRAEDPCCPRYFSVAPVHGARILSKDASDRIKGVGCQNGGLRTRQVGWDMKLIRFIPIDAVSDGRICALMDAIRDVD